MISLYACLPILFAIIMMAIFNVSSKIVLPIAFLICVIIAFLVWKIDVTHIFAYSTLGFLKSFEVLAIIFGAVLLLNTMKISGGMHTINNMFTNISPDKRVQVLIIGWLFGAFLEAVSGFGATAALIAPLLITLGFPSILAIFISLIFNTVPVTFGAVGAPVLATISAISGNLEQAQIVQNVFVADFVSQMVLLSLFAGSSIPIMAIFIMTFFFAKKGSKRLKSFIEILPFTLYVSFAFLIPFYFLSKISYELPSLFGSIVGLAIVIFTTVKFNFLVPKNLWTFDEPNKWNVNWQPKNQTKQLQMANRNISLFKALLPYILIALILLFSRIPSFGLQAIFLKALISFDFIFHALNIDTVHYSFVYGYNPGIMPFILIALLLIYLHNVNFKEAIDVWKLTLKSLITPTIALFSVYAIVQIMLYSKDNNANLQSMLSEIASFIAHSTESYYLFMSPAIGVLGTFIAGSAAVSNVLFSSLQFETATLTGLSPSLILALHSIGSSLGNMVAINKIIAVSITAGMPFIEGRVIRINIIPCIIYILIVCSIAILII